MQHTKSQQVVRVGGAEEESMMSEEMREAVRATFAYFYSLSDEELKRVLNRVKKEEWIRCEDRTD